METRADHVLMGRVREGDASLLAVLFERHHRALFHYFLRLSGDRDASEDLVQDVFFRMLKYRRSYREQNEFTAWMYGIARNAARDRAVLRHTGVVPIDGIEPASGDPDPRQRVENAQEARLLRPALAVLPEDKREVLVLSRFQDLNYEQIAEILACDVGAVKVRVYRALKALSRTYRRLADERAS